MTDRGSFSLESVLDSPSLKEIKKLSPFAIQLANRWVKESPQKARELVATGKFVATIKQRAEDEALRQWRSRIRVVRSSGDSGSPAP